MFNILKQVFKPFYRRLPPKVRILFTQRKSRHELYDYWQHPPDEGNRPEAYLSGEERSKFFVSFVANKLLSRDAKILELGCNAGRNLQCLFDFGYAQLAGIEISEDALALMRHEYP